MFSLISVWINGLINNHEAGDLRRYSAHYDVIVMLMNQTILDLSVTDNSTYSSFIRIRIFLFPDSKALLKATK